MLTFKTDYQRLLIDFNPTLKLLPPELSNASALNYIGCEGNELLSPGMEVLAKGVKPVLLYLKCLREVPLGTDQLQLCRHMKSYLSLT